MSEGAEPEGVAVPLVWSGPEDVPILFANAFVSQFDNVDGFIVTVGQITPPALIGTPDEVREQVAEIEFVAVKPVVRLGLTRFRMVELIAILQANLDQYDRASTMRGGDPR